MLTLVPGGMGGSETYARALVRELGRSERVTARVLVNEAARGLDGAVDEHVVEGVTGGAGTADRLRTLASARLKARSVRAAAGSADVWHFPLSVPAPRAPRGTPFVQTLLDVQHLELPELFTRVEREYRRVLYDRTAQRADAVITISHAAKDAIARLLRVPRDRIHVAHLGVDLDQYSVSTRPREDFVLYPARGWPHKNHRRLVEAMTMLRERRPSLRLVLTGGGLDTLGALPPWVEVRGLVSQAELTELYATAGCLAFPSLYEGFGLPPLEAMASGCPVAASDRGSIPEICGDAAVIFDPDDPVAIAEAIDRALGSGDVMRDRGLARVASFTWPGCARVHEEVYQAVAAQRQGRALA